MHYCLLACLVIDICLFIRSHGLQHVSIKAWFRVFSEPGLGCYFSDLYRKMTKEKSSGVNSHEIKKSVPAAKVLSNRSKVE